MNNQTPPETASEPRFFIGALGLFYVATMLMLAIWSILPSLLLGWEPVVITSGSMHPTIQPGDIVVGAPPQTNLGGGTVVVFDDPAGRGLVTHRIWTVRSNGDYITKGDANYNPDSTPIQDDDIVSVGRILVPLIGKPGLWMRSDLLKFGGWVLMTALAFYTSRWAIYDKYDPWTRSKPGVTHRRKRRDYVAQHARPSRLALLGPTVAVLAFTGIFLTTGLVTEARAAWVAQAAPSPSTFHSSAYTILATVDVAISATTPTDNVKESDEVEFAVTVQNLGTVATTATINGDIMVAPFDFTLEPGEEMTLYVLWEANPTGAQDIEFTVLTAGDVDTTNDLASVGLVVQK